MRFILFFLFAFSISFSQETHQFPKIATSISLPISLPISEIQRLTNQSITGVLYEDHSYENNNNDQLKTKVEKDGNISIKALTNNRLMFSVPLKIWAEKGVGSLGLYSYQSTQFRVVMNFISALEFQHNWSVKSTTTTAGFVWKEKPVLDYGRIKIPITSMIEDVLVKQQKEFTSVIDEQIKKKLNLQPYLVMAWNQFAQPIQISEEYKTWLKISPQSLKMTPLVVYADKIKTAIGIDLFSETFTGAPPNPNPLAQSVPNFISVQNLSPTFLLTTTANIPFTEATVIAQKQFLGKEFPVGDSKIKVEDIQIYPIDNQMMIEVKTSGKINGTSFIKGNPVYNFEKKRIGFNKTDFNLKTKNLFQKALSMLFEGKIVKMIEQDYGIPFEEMEQSSKKSMEESFNKEYLKGLRLQGKVLEFTPNNFIISPSGITVAIDTKAYLELQISGLDF